MYSYIFYQLHLTGNPAGVALEHTTRYAPYISGEVV